jgi:hypothetical protein
MPSRLSHFIERLVELAKQSVSGDSAPAVKKGDGGYADRVIIVIYGLREFLDLPYRRLLDVLNEMHDIVGKMGLHVGERPDFTTVCVRKQDQDGGLTNAPPTLTDFHTTGGRTGYRRNRLRPTLGQPPLRKSESLHLQIAKTTAVVDCENRTVLDIYCSMKQPPDTQVGQQVFTRNFGRLQTVTADKGYDWDDLREERREADDRPLIKHREFSLLDMAHNARHGGTS